MRRSASSSWKTRGLSPPSSSPRGPGTTGTTAAALSPRPQTPEFWYQSNLYLKLTATWWEALSTSVTYTYYMSPNDSFATFADVGLSFNLNDSKWLGAFAFNPSLLFAFETKGETLPSDGTKGIYMGLGLAPGYTFFDKSSFPVNISFPMTFGGPLLTMPLKFIPSASATGRSRRACSS